MVIYTNKTKSKTLNETLYVCRWLLPKVSVITTRLQHAEPRRVENWRAGRSRKGTSRSCKFVVCFLILPQVKLCVGPGQEAVMKLGKTGGDCSLFIFFSNGNAFSHCASTRANACETLNFLSVFPRARHSAWRNWSTEWASSNNVAKIIPGDHSSNNSTVIQ